MVRIRHEPTWIASGNEHSMLITSESKLMICGNSKGNRFCEKDYDIQNIYNVKKFQNIKKDLLNEIHIKKICTSDFHSLALTKDGTVLAWGGSVSENLSKRKSRLFNDRNLLNKIHNMMNPCVTEAV